MTRRRWTWIVYGACVLLVVQGLAWMSWQVLRLERREHEARARSELQQTERLCLWRMDSLVAPLVAAEAQRPYFEYRALLPAGRSYDRMWDPPMPGEAVVPSPLLSGPPTTNIFGGGLSSLNYMIDPEGNLTSPQAPSDADLARLLSVDPYNAPDQSLVIEANTQLSLLKGAAARPQLAYADGSDESARPNAESDRNRGDALAGGVLEELAAAPAQTKQSQSRTEFEARRQVADIALNVGRSTKSAGKSARAERQTEPSRESKGGSADDPSRPPETGQAIAADADPGTGVKMLELAGAAHGEPPAEPAIGTDLSGFALSSAGSTAEEPAPTITVGPFEPRWLEGEGGRPLLVLERAVLIDARVYRQGVWLEWQRLRETLLESVADLAPAGSLEPVLDAAEPTNEADAASRLATIPARFDIGSEPAVAITGLLTPTRTSLLLTWLGVLAAVGAIGVVLRAAIRLGDRRGRFVSAVTHELRTPLTTFQLYSQMLADGMVTDESVRADYLNTLKGESARLAGIVENVLAYARLSRPGESKTPRAERITPGELLARVRPVLNRRCEQSGMDLVVSDEIEPGDARTLLVDPSSVERILMNLVENACKYASPEEGAETRAGRPCHEDEEEHPETRVHLDVRTLDGELEMLVADYGPGIAPTERARVFGEFVRGSSGERADRSGLGLGLALSRALARREGGDLRLTRRRDHGAEFLLALPLQDASEV